MKPVLTRLRGGPAFHGLRKARIGLAVLLVLFHPTLAGVITVDETNCTLVDAIIAANTDVAAGGNHYCR